MKNLLTVYNICGIRRDSIDWYLNCIESILNQTYQTKVVISSCLNSRYCIQRIKDRFGDKVEVYYYKDKYGVNTTFNKTVLECSKDNKFDGFIYLDSGVVLNNNIVISEIAKRSDEYGMITVQVNTDTGYMPLGFQQNCNSAQIINNDLILPIGKSINLHAQFFSVDILNKFGLILPDVFAAFCSESVFPFINASIDKRWVIIKDIIVQHSKEVDGPSLNNPHISNITRTPWNNFLFGRDINDLINDHDAINSGIGYEECNNIVMHSVDAYENDKAKYPNRLFHYVKKYFFSTKDELNYDDIVVERY